MTQVPELESHVLGGQAPRCTELGAFLYNKRHFELC